MNAFGALERPVPSGTLSTPVHLVALRFLVCYGPLAPIAVVVALRALPLILFHPSICGRRDLVRLDRAVVNKARQYCLK